MVNAFAGPLAGAFVEDVLDAVEQRLVDDGLVAAGVLLAVVDDDPAVVGVAQHQVQLVH